MLSERKATGRERESCRLKRCDRKGLENPSALGYTRCVSGLVEGPIQFLAYPKTTSRATFMASSEAFRGLRSSSTSRQTGPSTSPIATTLCREPVVLRSAGCFGPPNGVSTTYASCGTRCTMPSDTLSRIITTDQHIDAAIARGRLLPQRRVVSAAYNAAADEVGLYFANGAHLEIPRRLLQGLGDATPAQLVDIQIAGPGTGLYWPQLDVAHYVPGLLDGVFGTRKWMAELGRRGGSVRTPAKAAASRKNGMKGGRPRKIAGDTMALVTVKHKSAKKSTQQPAKKATPHKAAHKAASPKKRIAATKR